MKTIAGAMLEFDIRACEEVIDPRTRALMHQVFLTGIAVGQTYANHAINSCQHGDEFAFGELKRIMIAYSNQIIAAQAEIKL